jgi:hypothetical protein
MATNTIVCSKMKSMVLIPVGVRPHSRLFIYEHFSTCGQGSTGAGDKIDGGLVVIYLWGGRLLKKSITRFIVSNFPHI